MILFSWKWRNLLPLHHLAKHLESNCISGNTCTVFSSENIKISFCLLFMPVCAVCLVLTSTSLFLSLSLCRFFPPASVCYGSRSKLQQRWFFLSLSFTLLLPRSRFVQQSFWPSSLFSFCFGLFRSLFPYCWEVELLHSGKCHIIQPREMLFVYTLTHARTGAQISVSTLYLLLVSVPPAAPLPSLTVCFSFLWYWCFVILRIRFVQWCVFCVCVPALLCFMHRCMPASHSFIFV